MGISLKPGAAEPVLQQLAERARSGDKQAQLELGIAFEEGRGIEKNLQHARVLYRVAASLDREHMWVYTPPISAGQSGRIVRVEQTIYSDPLPAARFRLENLERRLVTGHDKKVQVEPDNCQNVLARNPLTIWGILHCTGGNIGSYSSVFRVGAATDDISTEIQIIRSECPSPALAARGLKCNGDLVEIEVIFGDVSPDRCFSYRALRDEIRKFEGFSKYEYSIDTFGVISPPQQHSIVLGNSVLLTYPGIYDLKTCISRVLVVKPV